MKVTLLGTGTSQGVPVIGCDCEVCLSDDEKDNRLRSSVMIEVDDQTIIIDTGPDFRQQMLREGVKDIDAILFTHHHKDHVAGMDDVRAFNHKWKKDIDVFCNSTTEKALKREFPYVFEKASYPGVPKIKTHIFSNDNFNINNTIITPIKAKHYLLPIYGFRIYDFVYLTDVSEISENEKKKMKNADVIILDSLRIKPHISHFNLEQSVSLLQELKPKKALLTHISHYMGLQARVNELLPKNISLSFDRQSIVL